MIIQSADRLKASSWYDSVNSHNTPIPQMYVNKFSRIPSLYTIECNATLKESVDFLLSKGFTEVSKYNYKSSGDNSENVILVNELSKCIVKVNPFVYVPFDFEPIYITPSTNMETVEITPVNESEEDNNSNLIHVYYSTEPYTGNIYKEVINFFVNSIKPKVKGLGKLNIISKNNDGSLTLKEFKLPKKEIDITLNYGEEFLPVYETLLKRLNQNLDKGIALLHGPPGCGKTSLIRYLIHNIKNKDVIFIPPYLVEMISSPDFIPFISNHPNSIFIVEDAEKILVSRETNEGSSQGVSSLLNMGDGLLSDCLSAQFICTFNTDISNIDSALLRKGRLIAEYEFKPLSAENANKLLKHLGKETVADKPMSLADVYGSDEDLIISQKEKKQVIGFSSKRY